VRRHGWSGDLPGDDEEAVRRIIHATRVCIDRAGVTTSLADVARELGVTRQTVYRYFTDTEDLLVATAIDATDAFMDKIERHLAEHVSLHGGTPAEVVVEGAVYALEQVPDEPYVGILLSSGRGGAFAKGFTSRPALRLGRGLIERFPVDWAAAGFGAEELDELVEHMLRIMQSFVTDPGTPARTGEGLRRYLMRWLAPAITAQAGAGVRPAPAPGGGDADAASDGPG
jgi:AcrR family transcriptional regulator